MSSRAPTTNAATSEVNTASPPSPSHSTTSSYDITVSESTLSDDVDPRKFIPQFGSLEPDEYRHHIRVGMSIDFDNLPATLARLWASWFRHQYKVSHTQYVTAIQSLSLFQADAKMKKDNTDRIAFLDTAKKTLKKQMYSIFQVIVFPSTKPINTSSTQGLISLHVTDTSALGKICFQHIFENVDGGIAIDATTSAPVHRFDNPSDREKFWVTHELSQFAVQRVAFKRNSFACAVRVSVSKY